MLAGGLRVSNNMLEHVSQGVFHDFLFHEGMCIVLISFTKVMRKVPSHSTSYRGVIPSLDSVIDMASLPVKGILAWELP